MKAHSMLDITVVISALPVVPVHEVSGYADGDDVITFKRRNDSITDKVGADGSMAIARSADKSGELMLKLMQTSPTNRVLNVIHNLQQGRGQKFVPISFLFQDTYRQDRAEGTGYLKNLPEVARGASTATQEWTFVIERLTVLLDDPTFAGLPAALAEAI
jgi:hypothetical protein